MRSRLLIVYNYFTFVLLMTQNCQLTQILQYFFIYFKNHCYTEGKNGNLNSTNKLNTLGHEIRMQKLEYEQCIVHDVLEC